MNTNFDLLFSCICRKHITRDYKDVCDHISLFLETTMRYHASYILTFWNIKNFKIDNLYFTEVYKLLPVLKEVPKEQVLIFCKDLYFKEMDFYSDCLPFYDLNKKDTNMFNKYNNKNYTMCELVSKTFYFFEKNEIKLNCCCRNILVDLLLSKKYVYCFEFSEIIKQLINHISKHKYSNCCDMIFSNIPKLVEIIGYNDKQKQLIMNNLNNAVFDKYLFKITKPAFVEGYFDSNLFKKDIDYKNARTVHEIEYLKTVGMDIKTYEFMYKRKQQILNNTFDRVNQYIEKNQNI